MMSKSKPHSDEEKIAAYINTFVVPQDLKISKLLIKNQVDKNGEAIVYIRLRRYDPAKKKDFKEKRISTNVRVKPINWSAKKGIVLPKDFEHIQKNRKIREKEAQLLQYINNPDYEYKFAQLSKTEFLKIEEVFPSKRFFKYKKSLFDYIDDYHKRRVKLGHKRATTKEYVTLKNRVKKYDDNHRQKKTYLNDVNLSWSDDFEIWLNSENYSSGTIEKTYTLLIAVLSYYWEIRDEQQIKMNDKFKSKNFKRGRPSKNEPHPLNEEQLLTLYNHDFQTKSLNKIKKMIAIQCFSGLRSGDLHKIRPHNIIDNYLIFTPSKTEHHNVKIEQPVNKYLKELLDEVGNNTEQYKMQNQPYNRKVKEIFGIMQTEYPELNYDNNYTTHNFRDTFISLAVSKGVNWKSILLWVGQSSYKVMDRYVSLSKTFNDKEMAKMFD